MNRRDFITLLAGTVAACPLAARARQPAMPVVGALHGVSAVEWSRYIAGLRNGLSESGFVERRNVTIEFRWAEGQFDREPLDRGAAVIAIERPSPADLPRYHRQIWAETCPEWRTLGAFRAVLRSQPVLQQFVSSTVADMIALGWSEGDYPGLEDWMTIGHGRGHDCLSRRR
jgi:hypothetical protein